MKEVPWYQVVSHPPSTQIPVGVVNCCIVRISTSQWSKHSVHFHSLYIVERRDIGVLQGRCRRCAVDLGDLQLSYPSFYYWTAAIQSGCSDAKQSTLPADVKSIIFSLVKFSWQGGLKGETPKKDPAAAWRSCY